MLSLYVLEPVPGMHWVPVKKEWWLEAWEPERKGDELDDKDSETNTSSHISAAVWGQLK